MSGFGGRGKWSIGAAAGNGAMGLPPRGAGDWLGPWERTVRPGRGEGTEGDGRLARSLGVGRKTGQRGGACGGRSGLAGPGGFDLEIWRQSGGLWSGKKRRFVCFFGG